MARNHHRIDFFVAEDNGSSFHGHEVFARRLDRRRRRAFRGCTETRRRGRRVLHQIPIGGRLDDASSVVILKIGGAAKMVAVAVSKNDHLDLRGIQTHSLHLRNQHVLHFVRVARVDQNDSRRGSERINDGTRSAKGVQIVKELCGLDQRIGRRVRSWRRAEEFSFTGPFLSRGLFCLLDKLQHSGRIWFGWRGFRSLRLEGTCQHGDQRQDGSRVAVCRYHLHFSQNRLARPPSAKAPQTLLRPP